MVDFGFISTFVSSLQLDKFFLNPEGLYALLAVLPLIIFYLIKPKPKDKIIPSLMFILAKDEKFMENSFFRRLLNDFLFFLQLFILIVLGTAAGMPYIYAEHDVSAEDSVLVMDVSGSMATSISSLGQTRMSIARQKAKDFLSDKNTVVFASDIPELMLKDGSRGDADKILSKAKPRDTGTNLGDAIQFAADQLTNKKGKIVVISDFINSETDPISIKKVLESKDIKVDFIDISAPANNIGIIDLSIGDDNSIVFVKNYKATEENVGISVAGASHTLKIAPRSLESLSFTTPKGQNKIELKVNDDFPRDDVAYISTPTEDKTKVLFISNSNLKSNLYYALAANPKNQIEVAVPPIVPNVNHETYIIQQVDKNLLLPETIRKISEGLDKGSAVVIVGQKDIFDINFRGMMPVDYIAEGGDSYVRLLQINSFTRDVDFGKITYHHTIKPKEGTVVIAASDATNATLIAYSSQKNGKVIYYNIDDDESEFKSSITYPIFWNTMLDTLINRDSIATLNYKTGQSLAGKRFDNAGFVIVGSKAIAVNMLNDRESDVGKAEDITKTSEATDESKFKTKRETPLDNYLVLLAVVLLFFEFLYIKFRGDL